MTQDSESFLERLLSKYEPRSNTYVILSACFAALILGLTLFLLIRAFQWRSGLAALRAEPGIEILAVERAGFFKKRLRGLKDPLAPTAESILKKHNIGPHRAIILLTEYHSLNTPYALERQKEEESRFRELKDSLTKAVGDFASTMTKQREADLETITKMLFEAKFPQEMESVKIRREKGDWVVEGELYKPHLDKFLKEAPSYLVDGELIADKLTNRTASRLAQLRDEIHFTDLSKKDLDGKLVHIERMRRLLKDFDEICEISLLPPPRYRLESNRTIPNRDSPVLQKIRTALTSDPELPSSRFLPDAVGTADSEAPVVSLQLIQIGTGN